MKGGERQGLWHLQSSCLHKAGNLGASLCLGSARELLTGMLKCDPSAVCDAGGSQVLGSGGGDRAQLDLGAQHSPGQGKGLDFSRWISSFPERNSIPLLGACSTLHPLLGSLWESPPAENEMAFFFFVRLNHSLSCRVLGPSKCRGQCEKEKAQKGHFPLSSHSRNGRRHWPHPKLPSWMGESNQQGPTLVINDSTN